MSRRDWRWFDFGVIPLVAALVRLCWIWPWLEVAQRWFSPGATQPYLPLWSVPALSVAGAVVTYVVLSRVTELRRARVWVVGIGLLAILGVLWLQYGNLFALWDARWVAQVGERLTAWETGIPPALVTLAVAALLWLRGVRDGREALTNEDMWRAFAMGFLALTAVLIVGRIDPAGPPPGVDRWIVALFGFGMTGLALTSLELSLIGGRNEAKNRLRLDRYWLGSAGVAIAGLLAGGLLVTAVVTPAVVARLFGWVPVVLGWIGVAVTYVMLAFAFVLFWLLGPLIEWLQQRARERMSEQPVQDGGLQRQFDEMMQGGTTQIPPQVAEWAQWIGLAVLIVGIVAAIALALRYWRLKAEEDVEETRETIFSADLLQAQLAALWRKLMGQGGADGGGAGSPYLSLEAEAAARREVRAIYQELLGLAKAQGHGREPALTPMEYVGRLAAAYPGARDALEMLTRHYVAVRYSEATMPREVVDAVRGAWARLRVMMGGES